MNSEQFRNRLLIGDCVDVMRELPTGSIAGCITDPPYNYEFIGRDWDRHEIERRKSRVKGDTSTLVKNIPYGSGLAGGVRNENWYRKNRENVIAYQEWCETWGTELYRVTKPGALVMVFNSTRTVSRVQVALENCGFYARDIIVWRRQSGIPKGLNIARKLEKENDPDSNLWKGWHSCLRNEWEAICVVQKPLMRNYLETAKKHRVGLFRAESDSGFQSNIIENIKRDGLDEFNIHCTVKPLELIEKLASMIIPPVPDNVVLDPFLGSGTTAVACKKLGIDYCGIEIDGEYVKIAEKRLAALR